MADIPNEIIKEYKLDQKVTTDGFIYMEIQKGMYGLPQAGKLHKNFLQKDLESMVTHRVILFQAYESIQRSQYVSP